MAIIWDQPSPPIVLDEDKEVEALIEEAELDADVTAILQDMEKAKPFLSAKGFGR